MVENMDDGVYLLLIIQNSVEGISLYLSCSSKGSEAERSPIAFPFCCFQLINLQRHLKQPFHSLGAGKEWVELLHLQCIHDTSFCED